MITGAGSGIGAACAPMLGAAGAHAVALDLDRDAAAATANDVGGEAVAADVSDPEAVQRALTAAAARSGAIDVLLNNAGIALDTHCFADTETSHFLRHLEVNMLFVINGIRMGAALRASSIGDRQHRLGPGVVRRSRVRLVRSLELWGGGTDEGRCNGIGARRHSSQRRQPDHRRHADAACRSRWGLRRSPYSGTPWRWAASSTPITSRLSCTSWLPTIAL